MFWNVTPCRPLAQLLYCLAYTPKILWPYSVRLCGITPQNVASLSFVFVTNGNTLYVRKRGLACSCVRRSYVYMLLVDARTRKDPVQNDVPRL
jgi:hypothetical protein